MCNHTFQIVLIPVVRAFVVIRDSTAPVDVELSKSYCTLLKMTFFVRDVEEIVL